MKIEKKISSKKNTWKNIRTVLTIVVIVVSFATMVSAKNGYQFPDGTPLQNAIKQEMANGNFSESDIEGIPQYSMEILEKNDSHIKLKSTTTITFKNPRGAGYVNGKWPKFEIKDDPELRKNGIIKPGDYDQTIKDYILNNIRNIKDDKERADALSKWDKYNFQSGPRTNTIEEIYEVTYPQKSKSSPLSSPTLTTSNDVLMGFTKNPHVSWIVTDRQTGFLGIELYYYKAGFELDAALGLRLPTNVNLNVPELMFIGKDYMMSSSIIGKDWDSASYSNANVPAENGNEFVARLKYFLGVVVRVAYVPVVDWHIEANGDYGKSFKTPIGPGESFPISNIVLSPDQTGLKFGWSVASLGIGLTIRPYLGTNKIAADWLARDDATGSGPVEYNTPSTTYNFGPVHTGDYSPYTDRANVRLSNFKYYLNLCRLEAKAPVVLHLGWTGFSKDWDVPIDIYTADCSEIFGGLYLGTHQGTSADSVSKDVLVSTPPSITVVSPNGAENWERGTPKIIQWSYIGNPGSNVKIDLLKGGALDSVLTYSTQNDGTFEWTILSTQTSGDDYKIRITSTSDSAYTDTSDNNFKISSQTTLSARRTIDSTILTAGSNTIVTVVIQNDDNMRAFSLKESVPSGWSLTRISDDASSFKVDTNEWVWFSVANNAIKTVKYKLTIPSGTEPGIYKISGYIGTPVGSTTNVDGDNIISIGGDILSYYRGWTGSGSVLDTQDLLKAADDWSKGTIPPGFSEPLSTTQLLKLADEWSKGQ